MDCEDVFYFRKKNLVVRCKYFKENENDHVYFVIETEQYVKFYRSGWAILILLYVLYIVDNGLLRLLFSVLISIVFVAFIINLFWAVRKETLFLSVSLGIQYNAYFICGATESICVPWNKIDNFLIIDVITCYQVLYFLAVSTAEGVGDKKTVGVESFFKYTKPPLEMLEIMYNRLYRVLMKNKSITSNIPLNGEENVVNNT